MEIGKKENDIEMDIPCEIQARWRKNLFKICVVLATIGTICEIVIYCIDASTKTLFLPHLLYRFRFIYIPSSMNLIMILLTYFCISALRISNSAKNSWCCALILFLCINTQFIHYVYAPLLALPCLAIFVSVLFANKKLTLVITIVSDLSVAASCAFASQELRKNDPQLLTDMGLALVIMLVSYIGASLLIKYVKEQLIYILSSGKRESDLLHKLQIDNLLGIYNRSKMDSVLKELICSGQADEHYYLLMLDLDYFKNINDKYGHLSGDQVLIRLADLIRQHSDVTACRYGGEEIVLFLKAESFDKTYEFADKLLADFREQKYSFDPDVRETFSCGIAGYQIGINGDEWLKLADDNLYKAKQAGRNQVYPKG